MSDQTWRGGGGRTSRSELIARRRCSRSGFAARARTAGLPRHPGVGEPGQAPASARTHAAGRGRNSGDRDFGPANSALWLAAGRCRPDGTPDHPGKSIRIMLRSRAPELPARWAWPSGSTCRWGPALESLAGLRRAQRVAPFDLVFHRRR